MSFFVQWAIRFISIIDRSAWIHPAATIGDGVYVGAITMVSANVQIRNHGMVQSYCNIGHDVIIGEYSSVESYVFMGGYSSLGEMAIMHTKSSVIPHKTIGKGSIVGFGSVVMRNVPEGISVFGNPAVKIKL